MLGVGACACNTFSQSSKGCIRASCSNHFFETLPDTLTSICVSFSAVPFQSSSLASSSQKSSSSVNPSSSTQGTTSGLDSNTNTPTASTNTSFSTKKIDPLISGSDGPRSSEMYTEWRSQSHTPPSSNPFPTITTEPVTRTASAVSGLARSTGIPFTLTDCILPITTPAPRPTHFYCMPRNNSTLTGNGTWTHNGTHHRWNSTYSCTYLPRPDNVTWSHGNRTASHNITAASLRSFHTTATGTGNITTASTAAAMYTGNAMTSKVQKRSSFVTGMIFIMGWIMT
jgi:hypothetical protein